MDVQPIQAPGTRPAQNAAPSGTAGITADFETFLTLLTAQMKHQDPLNPTDSTEFTAQLATFSGVEQQVRTNDLLRELQAGFATLGMGELGGWIGMEARADMPVAFQGVPVTLLTPSHALADRAELVVRDASGQIVQQLPIPLDDAPFEWSGQDASGRTNLPDGDYTISVQSWAGQTLLETRGALSYATVAEAVMQDGQVWLTMQSGQSIPASAVVGLRAAS